MPQPLATPPAALPPSSGHYAGQVVYIYAFDIAYDMSRKPISELLGQVVTQFAVDASKRNPRQLFFYRAQTVRLPPLQRSGPFGPVRIERSVKILPVGAISITIRFPFAVDRVQDLVAFHDLRFSDGSFLYDEVRALADELRIALAPYAQRPVSQLAEEEAYTVFCINSPMSALDGSPVSAEQWLHDHRREVASLLTEESDPTHLSAQEAEESTGRYYSYYDRDVVVVDWDAALLVDDPRNFDEMLYIMELANLQLAELEAYDRLLDDVIDRAYRDVGGGVSPRRQRNGVQRDLREIRVDLARLSDELSNITKFFGDWHLARIYQGVSARFHLADWHRIIDEKLKTLDDLYQLLQADRNHRWMMTLEITVVLLIIIEVVVAFMQWK